MEDGHGTDLFFWEEFHLWKSVWIMVDYGHALVREGFFFFVWHISQYYMLKTALFVCFAPCANLLKNKERKKKWLNQIKNDCIQHCGHTSQQIGLMNVKI